MAFDRRLAAAMVACLTFATSAPARAQTASDRETARALMDEGFARREKGDHKGALERFEAADALMHVPTTGLETARERIAIGQLIEARELLSAVTRYPARVGEPGPFAEARMQAQKLDQDLGGRIPQVRIVLRGAEGGSPNVTVDGAEVPATTLIAPRKVNPGPHTIVARVAGRERREQITLRERETKEVLLDLTTAAPPAATAPPPSDGPTKDEETPKAAEPGDGSSAAPRVLFYGGLALAGVGVTVGTITGLMSLSAVSTAKNGCNGNACPPPTHDEIDKARSLGNVSTVAFIVGGIGAGAAITGYLLGRGDAPAKDTKDVAVRIGPGSVSVAGTF